jgi:DNA-binding transcriptional regulator YhcF (GntR family)
MAQQETSPGVAELVRGDDLPLGVNLFWRLETLIRSGRLRPNERLPGVREFAAGAAVNVNTVRSVYRRLEEDGLAVSHHGLGTFVTPNAPVAPALERLAAQVAAEAIALGIDPRELARALYTGTSSEDPLAESFEDALAAPGTDEGERAARAAFRAQIARLEAQLLAYPEASSGDSPTRASALPRVAPIAELEAVRDELLERLRQAQAAAQKRSERHETARGWQEDALASPSSHRWESVSKQDLGEPGCGSVAVRPRWGPVGALMNWWRVKISSGCP